MITWRQEGDKWLAIKDGREIGSVSEGGRYMIRDERPHIVNNDDCEEIRKKATQIRSGV